MPITLELRPLYPSNWRELANWIKFERAGGHCEWCGRSLGLCHQPDWPAGRFVTTILSCAHLDQNPANNDPSNLASLCPRCHLRHDRRQHIQSAYRNRRKQWAVRDLFD
jgi:hypothetical protein